MLFNCSPSDLNIITLPNVTGTFSGSAAPYITGSDGTPGQDAFLQVDAMPRNQPLELIYTLTTPDGCVDSFTCTFEVRDKQANAGRF